MVLRRGHCYRRIKRPYTRHSKYRKKDYVKAIPANKVVRFDMGDSSKKYEKIISLISIAEVQIRHNALESARQVVNRNLHNYIGLNYFFKIHVYPHHVLRENKVITGAGADRLQTGMAQAYGKSTSVAAQVKKGTKLFSVFVNKENVPVARRALNKAFPRMPGKYVIREFDNKP